MTMYEFWYKNNHWRLFLRDKLTIFQHWFRYWLGADQATSHYLKQVYWRIYALVGLNTLNNKYRNIVSLITSCCLFSNGHPRKLNFRCECLTINIDLIPWLNENAHITVLPPSKLMLKGIYDMAAVSLCRTPRLLSILCLSEVIAF